jgi:uncharacterized protein YbjT (DUF2867 family)
MTTALVLGGTGLTGKKIIRQLLADKRYQLVKVPVRTKMDIIYDKLDQIQFDFDYPNKEVLAADEVFCCLGTTIKDAGSKEAFYKVDFTYVLQLATMAHQMGAKKIALISAAGANKNSTIFYNKTKGQIEAAIAAIGFDTCLFFRPSLLLGHRKNSRMGETVAKFFMSLFSFAIPTKYKAIESKTVADAMVQYMNNTTLTGVHFIENDTMLKGNF